MKFLDLFLCFILSLLLEKLLSSKSEMMMMFTLSLCSEQNPKGAIFSPRHCVEVIGLYFVLGGELIELSKQSK